MKRQDAKKELFIIAHALDEAGTYLEDTKLILIVINKLIALHNKIKHEGIT